MSGRFGRLACDDFEHPYAWHQKNVARAEKKREDASRRISDKAIAAGHGYTKPTELRKMPQYADLYAMYDKAYEEEQRAKDYAVKELAGHRQGSHGDRFDWYTSGETRKWRNNRKRNGW